MTDTDNKDTSRLLSRDYETREGSIINELPSKPEPIFAVRPTDATPSATARPAANLVVSDKSEDE